MLCTKIIEYGNMPEHCLGYFAYDDEWTTPKPAILIAPNWSGRDTSFCEKAEQLVKLGYVGFAMDIYGEAKIGTSKEEKAQLMRPYMDDRTRIIIQAQTAIDQLIIQPQVDSDCLGAIGYCLGGLMVLDMARALLPLKRVVSLHGLLFPPEPNSSTQILSKILVCHGYSDLMVPPEQVLDFCQEMSQRQADWQVHMYGHVMHAFTTIGANDSALGTVYNEAADRQSWHAATYFLQSMLKPNQDDS